MLTGTWLERLKLVAGLRFLLAVVPTLLLALLAEFFRFLLFVVVCRAGSALARPAKRNRGNAKNIMHTDGDKVWGCVLWVWVYLRSYSTGWDGYRGEQTKNIQNVCKHACMQREHWETYKWKHTLHREEQLAYNDPCFVFFRGETTRALTSPKTCTSKKEPLYHLHKCSTMDPDAQRNVNFLMISALQRLRCSSVAWARLLCWGRKHICVCLTEYIF